MLREEYQENSGIPVSPTVDSKTFFKDAFWLHTSNR